MSPDICRQCLGAVLLTMLAGQCSHGSAAYAQLGSTEEQFAESWGSNSSLPAHFPAKRALRYDFLGPTHCEVGFVDDRAAYIVVAGGRMTVHDVELAVRRLAPKVTHDLDEWMIDRSQARMYPPLSKLVLRSHFIPTGVDYQLRENHWQAVRQFFDGYGNQVGEQNLGSFSTIQPEAQLQGIYRNYIAGRGVARFTMVRRDGQVYAAFDMTFDSESPMPFTSKILIADPETWWQMAMHQTAQAIIVPARPDFPDGGEINYEQALASLVPFPWLQEILRRRYLACFVAAVDCGEVPRTTLVQFANGVSPDALGRALGQDMLARDNPIRQRRTALIGALSLDFSVDRLIKVLEDRRSDDTTRAAVQDALQHISAKFARHPPPPHGSEPQTWKRWWIHARRDRERG